MDLSCVKFCILIGVKTKLNDELIVLVNKQPLSAGSVEYEEEPWIPFKFETDDNSYEPVTNQTDSDDSDTEES